MIAFKERSRRPKYLQLSYLKASRNRPIAFVDDGEEGNPISKESDPLVTNRIVAGHCNTIGACLRRKTLLTNEAERLTASSLPTLVSTLPSKSADLEKELARLSTVDRERILKGNAMRLPQF
jgi:hypothetical protein